MGEEEDSCIGEAGIWKSLTFDDDDDDEEEDDGNHALSLFVDPASFIHYFTMKVIVLDVVRI